MKHLNPAPKRTLIGFYAQQELYDIVEKLTKVYACKSKGEFVRMIVLERAEELGYEVKGIENPTWGVRRDLAAGDPVAIKAAQKAAEKARAVQAAKRAEASARKLKTAERLYEERISDKSR